MSPWWSSRLSAAKYRLILGAIGLLVYSANYVALDYVDENKPFPFLLVLGVHMVLSIPALLYPLRGTLTLLVGSIAWAIIGFLIGWRLDTNRSGGAQRKVLKESTVRSGVRS